MPLLWLSVGFSGGVLLGSALRLPWPLWLGLTVLFGGLAFLEKRFDLQWQPYRRWRTFSRVAAAAVLAALCLGGLRMALTQLPPGENDLATRSGERLDLTGLVVQPPEVGDNYTSVLIQPDEPWTGRLLVRLPVGSTLVYGDRLRLVGELQPAPHAWSPSYTAWLERRAIRGLLYFPQYAIIEQGAGNPFLAWLFRLRGQGLALFSRLLPPKAAALMSGILLGLDDGLPQATQEAFRATGTAHLTAVSGVNIAVVIALVFGLFRRLAGRIGGLALSILAITAFTLLVGAPASAVRAALMGGLGLTGEQIGRRRAGIHALCLTAAVMTAFNPAVLWDAGFQLSFSATLGILWLSEPLQKGLTRLLESALPGETVGKVARPLGEYLLVTLAAQVTTLPILAVTFGQISLSSLFVNPLILPAQPPAMLLGGLALAFGSWIPPLGQFFAWLAWPLLAFTLKVVEVIGAVPGLVLSIHIGWGFAAAYYTLLAFFLAVYPHLGPQWKPRLRPIAILLPLGLSAALLWRLVPARPDGNLSINLLPNPGGPAALIRLPGGEYLLVNGGSSGRELGAALETWLPPTQRKLSAVFLTTAKNQSLTGLPEVLARWQPGALYWPAETGAGRAGRELSLLTDLAAQTLETGQVYDLGGGVTLSIPAADEDEAALRLRYGDFDALLTGGLAVSDYQRQPDGLDFILLTPAELETLQPDGLRSLGGGLELEAVSASALNGQGAPWLALAQQTWLRIVTDGRQAWVTRQP